MTAKEHDKTRIDICEPRFKRIEKDLETYKEDSNKALQDLGTNLGREIGQLRDTISAYHTEQRQDNLRLDEKFDALRNEHSSFCINMTSSLDQLRQQVNVGEQKDDEPKGISASFFNLIKLEHIPAWLALILTIIALWVVFDVRGKTNGCLENVQRDLQSLAGGAITEN